MRRCRPPSPPPARPCDALIGHGAARPVACLAALLLAFAGQARSSGAVTGESSLQARILAEIGAARCDIDADCRTLAVGHKACGGPQLWLAWSGGADLAGRLEDLAGRLSALQRRRDERSGAVSNCQFNADPGATCQAGRCTLGSQKGRAGAN